jgi:hypothetical protein
MSNKFKLRHLPSGKFKVQHLGQQQIAVTLSHLPSGKFKARQLLISQRNSNNSLRIEFKGWTSIGTMERKWLQEEMISHRAVTYSRCLRKSTHILGCLCRGIEMRVIGSYLGRDPMI